MLPRLTLPFALLCSASAMAQTPPSTIYLDATVIDGTGTPAKPHQDIVVTGERITAIRPHTVPRDAKVQTVDLHGRFVIPGLIDSHVHLATPPNQSRARAILRRNLYGGVTAVRDMADDLRAVGELAREARTAEIPSPDIFYAAVMAGPPFFKDPRIAVVSQGVPVGTAPWAQQIDGQTDLRTAITLARGTSATAIKIYADLPAATIAALSAEAHRQHMMVWAHSAVFPTRPAQIIAAGPDVISHVCYLAYQGKAAMPALYEDRTPVGEGVLAAQGDDPVIAGLYRDMLKRGTILDATGSLFVHADAELKDHPGRKPLRCTGPQVIQLTRQAWRARVPISTGTDSVADADNDWPDVHDELQFLAHDVGMPPLAVIRAATLVGAQAAGQAQDMGSLEPGKLANFVVLTADPSADIANINSIETVVKRGRAYLRRDYRPISKAEMGNDD
jgi:imidazolonepropionase-like amidohydrolase